MLTEIEKAANLKLKWLKGLGDGKERTAIIDMSPVRCSQLLALNTINPRPMNMVRARSFSEIVRKGKWKVTHQGAAIDNEGHPLDAQHRLKGIELSGETVPMRVTWNMSRDVLDAIDIGKARMNRHICHDIDSRTVEGLVYFAELHGHKPCQPFHIRMAADTPIGQAIDFLTTKCGSNVRHRAQSPIKFGAALRYLEDPEYVSRNWRAFLLLDFPEMSPSIQSLVRSLTNNKWEPQGTRRNALAVRSYVAFNPGRRNLTQITVKKEHEILDKMREAAPFPE